MRHLPLFLFLTACSAAPVAIAPAPPPAPTPSASPAPSVHEVAPAPASASAPVASAEPPKPPDPGPAFPPAAITPPHERSAQPNDGVWAPLPEAGKLAEDAMVRTTLHPDTISKFIPVMVVAVDLRKVGLHLVAGTKEPASKTVAEDKRPGVVPASDQPGLIAVFNGGLISARTTPTAAPAETRARRGRSAPTARAP